jgi:hypothetical protein
MRFGKCTWSESGDQTKHHLVLVERSYDEQNRKRFRGFNEPEFSNMERTMAYTRELVEALLEAFRANGSLSDDELARVQAVAEERIPTRRRMFLRDTDVDEEIDDDGGS